MAGVPAMQERLPASPRMAGMPAMQGRFPASTIRFAGMQPLIAAVRPIADFSRPHHSAASEHVV
jgi:hypothetical protein